MYVLTENRRTDRRTKSTKLVMLIFYIYIFIRSPRYLLGVANFVAKRKMYTLFRGSNESAFEIGQAKNYIPQKAII